MKGVSTLQKASCNLVLKLLAKHKTAYIYESLHNKFFLWAHHEYLDHLKQYHVFTLKPRNNATERMDNKA